ncbi:MAG: SAM-dependent chlorinase/fluorinase [Sulfolobales archaeon]
MRSNVIALITDFGLLDPYVGMVKAVINRINPHATIIDITHEIPKYRVDIAALILKTSYKYFKKRTIFLAIVDPEVGTSRKALVVITKNYTFIGPNNGILTPAAVDDGIETLYEIDINKVKMWEVSKTFHGRDVFAPAAALLSLGTPIHSICEPLSTNDLLIIEVPPKKPLIKDNYVEVKVFYIDSFGNIVLEHTLNDLLSVLETKPCEELLLKVNNSRYRAKVVETFANVCEGCIAIYSDSFGLAEVGVFKGNASKALGVKEGDVIRIGKVE